MTKIGMVANLIMNKYGERNDLEKRLINLYKRVGIDYGEEIDLGDLEFMIRAMRPQTKEWIKLRLSLLRDMINEAKFSGEYEEAEEAIGEWEDRFDKID